MREQNPRTEVSRIACDTEKAAAVVCRYCGRDLPKPPGPEA